MTAQINKSTLKTEDQNLPKTGKVNFGEQEVFIRQARLKTLLVWRSAERPFKVRSRDFWTTVLAIVILLGIILVFLKEFLLITVIIAFVFVFYVYATVDPQEVEHQITTRGIVSGGRSYNWEELGFFWFTEKWGEKILNIQRTGGWGGKLMMLLGVKMGGMTEDKARSVLKDYLAEQTPEPTYLDKMAEWMGRKFPLEER